MVIALNKPRSPLSMIRREHKDLLDRLAPKSQTRVRCCAAQLIAYFQHWHSWKQPRYPSDWIYQPLTEIRHDLMDAFTIHVIRDAIAVLQRLGFLSVRKNDRAINWRNGQDKTHQYYLHSDRIEAALLNRFKEPMAETREKSPFVNSETSDVNSETSDVNSETSDVTDETYTQIPYSNSCSDSCSLEEAREKLEFLPREEEAEVSQSKSNFDVLEELIQENCDNNISSDVDEFSAAPAMKYVVPTQDDMKPLPKLKCDRSSGFRSDAELDGFYQALLELGKSKGKNSPVGWASAIIKSVDAGDPCQYLNEYRSGLLVGSCEQQEWESTPGQPYEQFVMYLKTKNKKSGMTDEEAIALAHEQLSNTNVAKSLWESCKRSIARYQDDWEKQKRLGVKTPYLPPELLPPQEVSLKEAAIALQNLSSNSVSVQVQEVVSSGIELSLNAGEESSSSPAVDEPALVEESPSEEKPTLTDLQTKLNLPLYAGVTRVMVHVNPQWGYQIDNELKLVLPAEGMPPLDYLQWLLDNKPTAGRARQLIAQNPEWGFLIDEEGRLWDF